jgi:fibronectin-binding autotransporter adhesin
MTHMTHLGSLLRRTGAAALVVGLAVALPLVFAVAASAQTTDCPAGGPGAPGGDAGRSVAGNGGLAFTVGGFGTGFSTPADATAPGGSAGSAAGGTGGRGGTGTLPICNQNTNNVGTAAPAAPSGYAAPGASGGAGNVLARTGVSSTLELGLAGLAVAAGGFLLYFGQPKWGRSRA